MEVRPVAIADGDKWTALRSLLWPDASNSADVRHYFQRAKPLDGITFVAESPEGMLCGFAELSIRREYVEGATTTPVAYLEGLFVLPSFRQKGIARQLIEASERWAREQGCLEFASDTVLSNEVSISVHVACGFTEVERAVAFIKTL
ncbi:MAG: GNAT family N-acetyltransferase [Verrucomicrobiaceae bacterium]|nr:GNAT family N-acetyltransferase [Verrucomicrobiaceae bacterium]